jgi:hypothetical protein
MPTGLFALAPAKAVNGPLDFTKPEHSKIYKSAIRAVSYYAFNCEADGLFQFLRDLQDRSIKMGWMEGILKIPMGAEAEDKDAEVEEENILENYGSVTLEQVVRSELRYIDDRDRKAQDTYMLYRCLMSSLTSKAKKKVMIWSDQYHIGGNKMSSGEALLKVIIRESHLDTSATTNQIRTKLSALDTYVLTINSDIGKFNQYVKL